MARDPRRTRSASRRVELEVARVCERLERGDPYWPAQAAIAAAIALGLLLAGRVSVGPTWLMPAVEGVLLVALALITPARATAHDRGIRRFALSVIGLVSLANIASLVLLVHYLIDGGRTGGHELILSGLVLWVTNVLLFGVWYWELDRGGPVDRFLHRDALPDLQFPQMDKPEFAPPGWRPGFVDYLYVSLTNATAFSPTDTMPLTQTAKCVMSVQSLASLLTIGLVVARAVNILN